MRSALALVVLLSACAESSGTDPADVAETGDAAGDTDAGDAESDSDGADGTAEDTTPEDVAFDVADAADVPSDSDTAQDGTDADAWEPPACPDITALGGLPGGAIYGAGDGGIYRWENGSWVHSYRIDGIHHMFASAPDGETLWLVTDEFVSGCGTWQILSDVVVLVLRDDAWTEVGRFERRALPSIGALADGSVWVAANRSSCDAIDPEHVEETDHLYRLNADAWEEVTPPEYHGALGRIVGSGEEDLWMGAWGGFHRLGPEGWSWIPIEGASMMGWGDFVVDSADRMWATDIDSRLWRGEADGWSVALESGRYAPIALRAEDEVWTAGTRQSDGSGYPIVALVDDMWTEIAEPDYGDDGYVADIWSPDGEAMWLVGPSMGVQSWNGSGWNQLLDCLR